MWQGAREDRRGGPEDQPTCQDAIVVDYDRTLTDDNLIAYGPALGTLRMLQAMNRMKVIIATGRSISFMLREEAVFGFADAIVAEDGAVIWVPKAAIIERIGDGSQTRDALRSSGIPFEEGDVVVSVDRGREVDVKRAIRREGLQVELQYNQNSLMILPEGIDKAAGVKVALRLMGIPSARLVCIGDGENDLSLFKIAKLRVATEGSVQVLKDQSDVICHGPNAVGVTRFLEGLLQ